MTSLGLVVRKIKQQSIFSYYWVKDAIDASVKELAERKLLSFEDSLRRSALPSITVSSVILSSTSSTVNTMSMSAGMSAGVSSDKSGDPAQVAVSVSGFTLSGMHRTASIDAVAGLSKGVNNMAVLPGISAGQGQGQGQGQERRRRFGISEIQEQLFNKGNVPRISSVIEEPEQNKEQETDLTSQKSSDSGALFDYLYGTALI